jgi:hypothetical protein
MKFKVSTVVVAVFTIATPAFAGFDDFGAETAAISALVQCPAPKITTTPGLPDLYGCIFPGAEVMKVFVNANDNGGVENVKVMWNDWTRDVGYGVHTDKEIAEGWASAIATKYAPEQVADVLEAFRGTTNKVIDNDRFSLAYTYDVGPSIDERLIVITEK